MFALVKKLVSSRSSNKDRARREFILNVLLFGLIILSFVGFIHALVTCILDLNSDSSVSPSIILFFSALFSFLLVLSKKGRVNISAGIFIAFLYLSGLYTILLSGADVPQALLIFALIIVMAGILVNTVFAFVATFLVSLTLLVVSFLQAEGYYAPHTQWKTLPHNLGDTVVAVVTLAIIALVSWLFNRESEKALKRARESEAALKKYTKDLEIIVKTRTGELQQIQVEQLMQMYRFSEFGRISSGLFHDLVNHLNLISLNLDLLNDKTKHLKQDEIRKLLERAVAGTNRLEDFVMTAKKQMQNQEVLQMFSLKKEINQVIQLLSYREKKSHVKVLFHYKQDVQTFANPIKFTQVMTNLIVNAIDAYDGSLKKDKRMVITLSQKDARVQVTIQDWGSGISATHLPKVFDSLFTTKSFEKGMGLGLAICRDIVEKDFRGSIGVKSTEKKGTIFILDFPIQNADQGKIKSPKS